MQAENIKSGTMKKRCVMMADGKRHLIYYTFEKLEPSAQTDKLPVAETENEATEETGVSENV